MAQAKQVFIAAALAANVAAANATCTTDCGTLPYPGTGDTTTITNSNTGTFTNNPTMTNNGTVNGTVTGTNTNTFNPTNTNNVTGTNTNTFNPNNTNTNNNASNASAGAVAYGGNSAAYGGTGYGGSASVGNVSGGNANQYQGQQQGQTLNNQNTVNATTGASTSNATVQSGAVQTTNTMNGGGANVQITNPKPAAHSATAPTVVAPSGNGCVMSKGGFSLGAQVVAGGLTGGYSGGTEWNESSVKCAEAQVAAQSIGSTNAALRYTGMGAAAILYPDTYGVALGDTRNAVANKDPLLGALGNDFAPVAAAAPQVVVVPMSVTKEVAAPAVVPAPVAAAAAPVAAVVPAPAANKGAAACVDKPGTLPVLNTKTGVVECRSGRYSISPR